MPIPITYSLPLSIINQEPNKSERSNTNIDDCVNQFSLRFLW